MDLRDAGYYINIQENNENKGSQTGHTKKKTDPINRMKTISNKFQPTLGM
jgi:hypothetical protein